MPVFKACNPNVEVSGETILSFVEGTGAYKDEALNVLRENGVDNPQPGRWYNQQIWLNSFKSMSEKFGKNILKLIGKSIPRSANFSQEINSIESAIASINTTFHANHRNGEIGEYIYEKSGNREADIVCKNPYPCSFNEGLIKSITEKFKPKDSFFVRLSHEETSCSENGNGTCTFHVKW